MKESIREGPVISQSTIYGNASVKVEMHQFLEHAAKKSIIFR